MGITPWWAKKFLLPKDIQVLIPGTWEPCLYLEKGSLQMGLSSGSWDQDLKFRILTLSWIIVEDPKCPYACPYKRCRERFHRQKRRRPCDHRGRDWIDWCGHKSRRVWNHQMLEGTDSLPEPREGIQPCWHLDFGSVVLILDFWPLELWWKNILLF